MFTLGRNVPRGSLGLICLNVLFLKGEKASEMHVLSRHGHRQNTVQRGSSGVVRSVWLITREKIQFHKMLGVAKTSDREY